MSTDMIKSQVITDYYKVHFLLDKQFDLNVELW